MERALIVNDDQLMSYAISKALQPYHPEIKTVSNGNDAITEISSCFYPLCFLDVSLPGLNGSDTVRKIREVSPDTKVIVFTPEEHPVNGAKDFIGEKIDEKNDMCHCIFCAVGHQQYSGIIPGQRVNHYHVKPYG